MSSPFRSLASIDTTFRSIQPSPIPQADQDQLICVNTTNHLNEADDKNAQMNGIIDTLIVPCVPIYGLFSQTPSQVTNVNLLFKMFSEYEDKMRVVTTSKKGKEISTSAAVELVNEGSNAICNFTLTFNERGIPNINFQYVDTDLKKYNRPFTEHMNTATTLPQFLRAMGLLIIENIFLYGLDGVAKASHGCQGTFFMYYNRPLGGEGFHKDSTGNTSFVCLNYLNRGVLPSATILLNPTPIDKGGEFQNVDDRLSKIMEVIGNPHCTEAQITKRYNMGPYGTIGFNDLVVAHSSPFDETSKNVRSFSTLVTTPGQYGESVPSPLSGRISGSPHPPLESYPDANIPRNFTRMWINFKDPSVADNSVVAFPAYTISLYELEQIINNCRQKSMGAKKCLSVEELCASFIDPMHNPGTGTCSGSLSRSNSPAFHPQGIPYIPASTTTTPNALMTGKQSSSLFRPVAVPAPVGSSLTTTAVKDDYSELRDYDDFSDQSAYALLPPAPLRKQMMSKQRTAKIDDDVDDLPDYDDNHPSNMGGSKEGSLRGYNTKTKRRYNKVSKKTSHNKVTKRKGKRKRNKVEGNVGLLASRCFPTIIRRRSRRIISKRKDTGKKTGKRNKVTKKHKRNAMKRMR